MAESVEQRIERLSQEMGGATSSEGVSKTSEEVQRELDQDLSYHFASGSERVTQRKEAFAKYGLTPPTSIASPGKMDYDPEGPVHKYVRPVLEGGGMIAGGILGASLPPPFTGPIGGAVGGGLGYAGGDALSSLLERVAGERPPVASIQQALGETAQSLNVGGSLEMATRGVGKVAEPILSKALAPFRSQYEGANKTLAEVAAEKGIQLDPHEILQSRPIALGHKLLENLPYTSGMIQRKEVVKLQGLTKEWERIRDETGTKDRQRIGDVGQKIQAVVEKELDRIGVRQGELRDTARDQLLRQSGSSLSYKQLGEQTQQALKDYHQGLKAVEDLAWDAAKASVPQDATVSTPTLKKLAEEIRDRYKNLTSFVDENLLGKLKNAAGSGNAKYDALVSEAEKQVPAGLPPALRNKIIADTAGKEKPGWKVADLVTLRSELSQLSAEHHSGLARGDAAKGSSDAYGKIYLDLKNAVDTELEQFSATQGTDTADLFAAARATTGSRKSFFNTKEHPGVAKAIMGDPAHIANTLIRPGSAAGYTELHALVGPAASAPVKKAFTNQLLNVGGKEAEGLPGLRRRLDQYGSQTLAEVYNPRELKNLYHLADQSSWIAHSPVGNPLFIELVRESPSQVAPTILGHVETTAKVLRQFPTMRKSLRMAFMESVKPNEMTTFPTQMLKHLNAYPKEVQQKLFTPRELKDFYDLATIVERTKGTVKMAENPSGTAAPLIAFSTAGAMLRHPIAAMPMALSSRTLAKIYQSDVGRKYLLEGLQIPASAHQAAALATRLLGVAGIDTVRNAQQRQRMFYLPTVDEQSKRGIPSLSQQGMQP